jgi:hypothetical protein
MTSLSSSPQVRLSQEPGFFGNVSPFFGALTILLLGLQQPPFNNSVNFTKVLLRTTLSKTFWARGRHYTSCGGAAVDFS